MPTALSLTPQPRAFAGVALTIALHLALLLGWRLAMIASPTSERSEAVQWLTLQPLRPAKKLPHPATSAAVLRPATTDSAQGAPTELAPSPVTVETPAPAAAPAMHSAGDILQQAKRDLGKIDRDLRRAYPGARIEAPASTRQTRLEQGFADAADAAPNRWFEAPKITAIQDPGGYGRRRYRVVTAGGTYCVTYESNHAPDGRDSMKDGIKPKITTCPEHEQAATSQAWTEPRERVRSSIIQADHP